MNPPKTFITDLDGVIRHFPKERDQEIEDRRGLPHGEIARTAFSEDLLLPAITGEVTVLHWRELVATRLETSFPNAGGRQAVQEWSTFSGYIDQRVLNYLRRQSAPIPLILLSNATDRLSEDLYNLGLDGAFDRIFNSSQIGYAKPDRRVFEYVLDQLVLSADDVFFIDDSLKNIEAAQAIGIRCYQFINFEKMANDLPCFQRI